LLDAEEFEAVLIDGDTQPRARLADGIVDVDDVRHGGEDPLQLVGDGAAGFGVGSIDLGQ